jgi:hypothetical protein
LEGGVPMPQLSVYLDDNMIAQIKENAKTHNISVSKFITNAVDHYMSNQWPEGFEILFGSVSDDAFERPADVSFSFDAKRETL